MGAYKWFMQTEFGDTRSRDQSVTGRKWVENLKKIWVPKLGFPPQTGLSKSELRI